MRRAILVTVLVLAGCGGSKESQFKPLSKGDADSLSAQRSHFDSAEDAPFTAQTHFAAGQLAESQGAAAMALEHYAAALKQDPKHLPSLYRTGVLYAQLHQYPQAIDTWRTYIAACGNDATGYSNLGFCYDLAGQPADAEAAYREGLAKDANNAACHVNYGLLLAKLGRTDDAVAQLKAVLPESQAWYNVGSVCEQRGDRAGAKAAYRKAIELNATETGAAQRLSSLGQE
ncbi:MAG: tetratricopeptide repeat protein [Tepidisphaerales bacterium]